MDNKKRIPRSIIPILSNQPKFCHQRMGKHILFNPEQISDSRWASCMPNSLKPSVSAIALRQGIKANLLRTASLIQVFRGCAIPRWLTKRCPWSIAVLRQAGCAFHSLHTLVISAGPDIAPSDDLSFQMGCVAVWWKLYVYHFFTWSKLLQHQYWIKNNSFCIRSMLPLWHYWHWLEQLMRHMSDQASAQSHRWSQTAAKKSKCQCGRGSGAWIHRERITRKKAWLG